MLYVDPLGNKITTLNTTNKINKLKKNNVLNDARLEDIEIKIASNKLYFMIYSIFACIFIIMFLVLFKKLSK